ncbi:MAG TPA: hypothetical protein VGM63_01960 [Mucilaginibacter sp.]
MSTTGNFNDLIIDYEAKLLKNRSDKELLLRESFILWYILVEGMHCENFSEVELKSLLMRNAGNYQSLYIDDADFNFIIGWMVGIAFWYFAPLIKEEDSIRLLNKAYKSNPKNSLFKWAVGDELNLKYKELDLLKTDIALRYDQFYNHGTLIKQYFLDIITTSFA